MLGLSKKKFKLKLNDLRLHFLATSEETGSRWRSRLIFVIGMWLLSRLVIIISMQLIAHSLKLTSDFGNSVPTSSWEIFSHWDGYWYRKIATSGYDYANDGKMHTVAFFPLFPLLTHGVMNLGLPFEVAGILVNNLAFLGALGFLYGWVEDRHGVSAARWATAVLAWCPFSLFGAVTYTEGLFLLCTTAALRAFDKHQHARAALWGALATAARLPGIALVPTFLLVAWRERRPAAAYATGLAAGTGLLLYIMYCAQRFGDPLALLHVQAAWHHISWLEPFERLLTPSSLAVTVANVIKLVMFFGGAYLFWHLRNELSRVAFIYGFCSFALILASGSSSAQRYAYGTVSLSLALGVLIARYARWGYAIISLFSVLLVAFSIRFACGLWVA